MTLSKISTFGKISGTGAVSGVEPVPPLLRTTKELVEYFKRNGLSRKLRKTLKTAIPTRWNSHVIMLESIQEQYGEVKKNLGDRNEGDEMPGWKIYRTILLYCSSLSKMPLMNLVVAVPQRFIS